MPEPEEIVLNELEAHRLFAEESELDPDSLTESLKSGDLEIHPLEIDPMEDF